MTLPTTIVAGITVPDTSLVKDAIDHARSELPPWLFNHVMRSWLFAVKLAEVEGAVVDAETLAVASIFHDIGLVPKHGTPDRRFEVDGAIAAVSFLNAHHSRGNVALDSTEYYKHKLRKLLIWDAIALHTIPDLADHSAPEVDLCQRGVTIDFRGRGKERPPDAVSTAEAVLGAYPRLGMKDEFKECLCDLVRSKPDTAYDNWVGAFGVAYVEGYERSKAVDEMAVAGLQANPLDKLERI